MSKISLLPLDTFNVINHAYLNDNDRKLLIMLYQPIVGAIGINLYFNLWTFLDREIVLSETYNHNVLLNLMGVTIGEIGEAREKLEGVGLLKTYLKEGDINNYLYELHSPLSAYEFFSNPLLSSILYTSLGTINYKSTKEYFKTPRINTKDYVNITESFSDVFSSVKMMDTNANDIKKKNYIKIGINSDLDIDELLNMIPDIMLNHTKVSDNIKELIIKLSFIYNFDFDTTLNLVKNSIDEKNNIDKTTLKNNYRTYYQFENEGSMPKIIFRNQPEHLRKEITDNSKKSKIIYQFENTSPYYYIAAKSNNNKPTKAEISILEMLLVDMSLNPGVVNVLINYVLKINDNKLSKNFVEAIASQWKRSNIQTVEEAMEISKKEYKKRVTNTKKPATKVVKSEEKPEWFDKDLEIKEDVEKQKKLEQMLGKV